MATFTVTISDAAAAKLVEVYGSMAKLKKIILSRLKSEVVEKELAEFQLAEQQQNNDELMAAVQAERERLEALYS